MSAKRKAKKAGPPAEVTRRIKGSNHPMFAVDPDNTVVAWNPDLEHLLGVTRRAAIGKKLAEVVQARDPFGNRWCADNCGIHAMVRRGDTVHGFTLEIQTSSGDPLRLFASIDAVGRRTEDEYHVLFTLRPDRRQRETPFAGLNNHDGLGRDSVAAADRDTRAVDLTHRQTQVLRLLAQGESTHDIAKTLRISLNTVRNHIQNSLSKLGAHSQAHAIAVAIRRRLI